MRPLTLLPVELGGLSALCALTGAQLSLVSGVWRHSRGGMLSFAVLAFAGGRMLLEAMRPPEEPQRRCGRWGLVCVAADAFLSGLTLPQLSPDVWAAAGAVGTAALLFSALGTLLPEGVVLRVSPWFSAAGGLVLTGIGMQLLLQSLL